MQNFKDILYLIGSILGIIGFIRTLKKRDYCQFTYRTEFGDEVNPFLICIKGDIFNPEISDKDKSQYVVKLPKEFQFSKYKFNQKIANAYDESAFFPLLKEGDALLLQNEGLCMQKIYLKYQDRYHNNYYQAFEFMKTEVRNDERLKRKSRSCYKLSDRYWKILKIWFPQLHL